jgi:uncharacterized cupredoxin-like copper-binding protein
MAVYFVLGSILVAWGLGLAIFGLLRPDFPPSGSAGRALVGVTVLIMASTLVALLATTEKEHPREEAAKAAEEKKASREAEETRATGSAPSESAPGGGAKTVKVSEKEFSIALAGGNKLQAGKYTFAVDNAGKIQHDLAIEGGELKETKTPLIDAGQSKSLSVDLKPGKYTFYCSVPGHEQSGMKVSVTVAGGGQPAAQKAPAAQKKTTKAAAASAVAVTEKEFSIALAGGNDLKAGKYSFDVQNQGKIQHDLAIEGDGIKEKKTKLIDGGKAAKLAVSLKPGKYKFYCSVPGHEQAGMKVQVTVK